MKRAQIYGGITVDLNDGPVRAEYSRGIDGTPLARLVIGEGSESLAITVSGSGRDVVDQLEKTVAELAAWTQRQEQLRRLPEVA